jgi:hypothetical protein
MNRKNTAIVASVAVAVLVLGAGAYWVTARSPEPSNELASTALAVRPDVSDKPPPDAPKPKPRGWVRKPTDTPRVQHRPPPSKGRSEPQDRRPGSRREQRKPVKKKYETGC